MKIRSYLAVLVVVTWLGGSLLTLYQSRSYKKASDQAEYLSHLEISKKELSRITADVQQYLISSDLIIGSYETYLVGGTLEKGDKIAADIRALISDLQESDVRNAVTDMSTQFGQLSSLVVSIADELIKAGQLSQGDVLNTYDTLAMRLVSATEITNDHFQSVLQENRKKYAVLDSNSHLSAKISQIVFFIVVAGVWLWSSLTIGRSLKNLRQQVVLKGRRGEMQEIGYGPKEVKDLSRSFAKLTSKLFFQANHDPLTGLYNRMAFNGFIREAFELAQSGISNQSLCYIDLDHFKIINDTCGHGAGDDLLKEISQLLNESVREEDIVSRLGGDEFTIIFKNCDIDEAVEIAESVRKKIRDYSFYWKNKKYHISSSIGVIEITDSIDDVEAAIDSADAACMEAKEAGKNNVSVFNVASGALQQKRVQATGVTDIRAALEQDDFSIFRQNIVPLKEGEPDGAYYEVLLRMKQQGRSTYIPPSDFFPIVERYRLFPDVDRWVVKAVVSWLSENENIDSLSTCSVNISGASIGNQTVLDYVSKLMSENTLIAKKLCFEITETEAIKDIEYAREFIGRLKNYGCRFALDDFGSGLSSFSYLKQLDVDFVKIDGQFVKDMKHNPQDRATVTAINDVAKAFGKKTVAEFVEDQETVDSLREIGVDFAQGFFFSEPRALDKS